MWDASDPKYSFMFCAETMSSLLELGVQLCLSVVVYLVSGLFFMSDFYYIYYIHINPSIVLSHQPGKEETKRLIREYIDLHPKVSSEEDLQDWP